MSANSNYEFSIDDIYVDETEKMTDLYDQIYNQFTSEEIEEVIEFHTKYHIGLSLKDPLSSILSLTSMNLIYTPEIIEFPEAIDLYKNLSVINMGKTKVSKLPLNIAKLNLISVIFNFTLDVDLYSLLEVINHPEANQVLRGGIVLAMKALPGYNKDAYLKKIVENIEIEYRLFYPLQVDVILNEFDSETIKQIKPVSLKIIDEPADEDFVQLFDDLVYELLDIKPETEIIFRKIVNDSDHDVPVKELFLGLLDWNNPRLTDWEPFFTDLIINSGMSDE